ncbi:MAG TPA: hypothetical protein PLX04_08130, partial [Caldisericia bacterium]|nr:hypothetical protein [Caldisericia bacterium]
MSTTTILTAERAKADGSKGTTGVVQFPIEVIDGTPSQPFPQLTRNKTNYLHGANVRPRWVPSDFSIIESFNGRIHPDALGLLLYAIHGTKVPTGTGAAKNHVFTPGDPFPIILRDRWSTTALKSFIKYRCMLTELSFSGDRLDDLVWTCNYVYTNQEMNVAHTSTTLGDVADMLMVSNITGKVTVFSLTPAGGSLIDLTAKGTKINWGVTRNATPSKAPIAVAPITGLPVPSAVTEYNLSL